MKTTHLADFPKFSEASGAEMEMVESGGELIRDNEERIFVSVRFRPLNDEEISKNDVSDWECINSDTIVYKNVSLLTSERSMYPTAYTFDRVFRSDCSTRMVYEQGVKDVAISVVRGVNSTVFAYGQTGSGKTYTMTGITEYAIADIYEYIEKHPEKEFILKFSAVEIYDESVRDLLSVDSTPLRLLDDIERGTIVENLTEEILRDRDQLTELLFICEAQRQTEETSLNEMSSKSHQIIRLTIESSPHEFLGRENASTLVAAVNFVDLAGSERASQSVSAGTRLKEVCHMDRSLLTLGAVIRKLSKEQNGYIPYRDSKLTQILQMSLGGNSKTAIICTMSPARSDVEQSRNTLSFAKCAKEVTTNAHVNVVMSDQALVRQLQKELARLEHELRGGHSNFNTLNYSALLRVKDAQIEKLEKEIKHLILQRDILQSQVKELSQMLGGEASSLTQVGLGHYPHLRVQKSPDHYIQEQETSTLADPQCLDVDTRTCCDELSRSSSQYHVVKVPYFDENFEQSNASPTILPSSSNFSESDSFYGWQEIEKQISGNLEDLCREVHRMETVHSRNNGTTEQGLSYSEDNTQFPAIKVHVNGEGKSPLVDVGEFISSPPLKDDDEVQEDILSRTMPSVGSEKESEGCGRNICTSNLVSSMERLSVKDCQSLPENPLDMEIEAIAEKFSTAVDGSGSTPDRREKDDILTEQEITEKPEKEEENPPNAKENVKDVGLDSTEYEFKRLTSWPVEFKRLQRAILELWHACNISLVHRTYFFLLFQGDPSDALYLEVEVRRMKLLKDKFSRGDKIIVDGQRLTLSSSAKTLRQERRMLSEQMIKKLSEPERERLFVKWGIGLNTKNRKLQLAHCVWSKTDDINHIVDSAFLVAKLIGFAEPGKAPSKEMFGINVTPKGSSGICTYKRSLGSLL